MIKKMLPRIIFHGLLLMLAMIYGVMMCRFKLPPYSLPETVWHMLQPNEYAEIPKEYTETDVAAIISIRQPGDVAERRKALIHFLWGRPELPLSLPAEVISAFADARYEDIRSLSRIDKVIVAMEYGIESNVYHFLPKNPNNRVVLYHQGHQGDFYIDKAQIRQFIDNGYAVAAFSMPLLGLNNQPIIQLPHVGQLKLTSHEQMKFLSPEHGHPIKYFIEPVVTVLNYLGNNFDYERVAMVGISGGGWTTTLAAAVDTRILKSYPVAGSYPIYLRSNSPRDWGDYEQTVPELYGTMDYLELYVLGAYGEQRKQLQILNLYDSCCFAGTKWETYKDVVRSRVRQLGAGEFDVFSDDSHHEHKISSVAMRQIINDIEHAQSPP